MNSVEPSVSLPSAPAAADVRTSTANQLARATFLLASILAFVALWILRHPYAGIDGDAQLYFFQAIARGDSTNLGKDLFLAYGSQDQYTLFSPLYAALIHWLGMVWGPLLLSYITHAGFLVAAYFVARAFVSHAWAVLAVLFLGLMPTSYGAGLVFSFSEDFVTARSVAEPLVIAAIAFAVHRKAWWAAIASVLALLMHPLIAISGVGIVALVLLPEKWRRIAILAGLAILAGVLLISWLAPIGRLRAIDKNWMLVLELRSRFLFLDEWDFGDWVRILLPAATLFVTSLTNGPDAERALTRSTVAVCLLGLLASAAATWVRPVEILVQTQPWRANWITAALATLLLANTVRAMWLGGGYGRAAAILLATSWIAPPAAALICFLSALAFWFWRRRLAAEYLGYASIAAWLACSIVTLWFLSTVYVAAAARFGFDNEPLVAKRIRDVLGMPGPAIACAVAAWYFVSLRRALKPSVAIAVLATGLLVWFVPATYHGWQRWFAFAGARSEFDGWRRAIPEGSTVLWPDNPLATWLLLGRPSYISTGQGAGVVFSRDTAMEFVRRVSHVKTLYDPETFLVRYPKAQERHVTRETLAQLCEDPALGFVVDTMDADGMGIPLNETKKQSPRLFDCRVVRPRTSP